MRVIVAAAAASLTVAVSIFVATTIHGPLLNCSYLGGHPPPPPCGQPTSYPLEFRLGVVAAGVLVAALIIAAERTLRR